MKKLIILFIAITVLTSVKVEATEYLNDIVVSYKDDKENQKPRKKTPPVVPQVSYEGTEFCVSVPLAIEGISVSIVDADSFAVYNGVSPMASKTHRFTVGSLNDGELYTIYVTIGSCVWTGDFIFTL